MPSSAGLSAFSLAGRTAIVTGGSGGIGRGCARAFAAAGADVVIASVPPEEIPPAVAEVEALGAGGLGVVVDVSNGAQVAEMVKRSMERFGRIDILVNNVGGTIWAKPFEYYAEAQIEAEVRRSLFPTLWCCHCVLPYMLEQGSGAIVNVSSVATRGVNRVPYGAAKGGVNALTACLALETAGSGIRVNATAPGGTEAPPRRIPRNSQAQSEQERVWYQQIVDQTLDSSPMKRYGSIDEQVGAILFLASDEASYITGVTLPVGGGDLG